MRRAVSIAVRGRVQGVGFRPFIFHIAHKHDMTGTVQNNMDGVKIHLEGQEERIRLFLEDLKERPPRLSKINEVIVNEAELKGLETFTIIPSERAGTSLLVIPVDSNVCPECLEEMADPDNFRYNYPFINCTQCGPRYTIIEALPYDRPYTTMKEFGMCPDCRREYEDPANRRHHAQPIACPKCGPSLTLHNGNGEKLECETPLKEAAKLLGSGAILAIKGLGGYHLCCDARNERAVAELRKRKNRPKRPLAVMAGSLAEAERIAIVSEEEKGLLASPESPIVILQKSRSYDLADSVACGMGTIGIMLPYTPLHQLLFKESKARTLIMTSANPSGMPILYRDEEAFRYLDGIADYFVMHNREILHPVDDSVVQLNAGGLDFLRRSRGYVPDPFFTDKESSGIVAFGGQQKTTFTIGRNNQVFIGPHIGDLENLETEEHYRKELDHLLKWIEIPRQTAVIDLHPGYQSRKLAKEYGFSEIIEIQHHHAHMAGCLEEHGWEDDAFGIILDGTGYGVDGNVWGFEIFAGNKAEYERLAHLRYTPLPGGEACIREPWRNAAAMLISLHGEEGRERAEELFHDKKSEIAILVKMIDRNLNTVYAGTCGRLFDAVSSICGVTTMSSYDGEAAILLAELVDLNKNYQPYEFSLAETDGLLEIDLAGMIEEIAREMANGADVRVISGRFHETIVQAAAASLRKSAEKYPSIKAVALSGGSFHNRYLRKRISEELALLGFKVFAPNQAPCNDGGLSYGQLAAAAAKGRAPSCVLAYQQKS